MGSFDQPTVGGDTLGVVDGCIDVLDTFSFGQALARHVDSCVCVPCSYLSPLINFCIDHMNFYMANDEGSALSICNGLYLAGRTSVLLLQNSGLGNALSPLTSFNHTFRVPVLGIISLRGEPTPPSRKMNDEPQHELMGEVTLDLLRTCDVEYEIISTDLPSCIAQLQRALDSVARKKSFFLVVRKGTFSSFPLRCVFSLQPRSSSRVISSDLPISALQIPTRYQALEVIRDVVKGSDLLSIYSTGKCGREAYFLDDLDNNLYMVGSMGFASSLALGISLAGHRVIAVDGDGSFLMQMGSSCANTYYAEGSLCHIVLDNQGHDSTGGQFTLSGNLDFPKLASGFGYQIVFCCNDIADFARSLRYFVESRCKTCFIHLRIQCKTIPNLPRPRLHPRDVAVRFMKFIAVCTR